MTGSLFSQLDMGKRALIGQQAGMGVAGHNIANINNENYSRQRVELEEQHPRRTMMGMGADVQGVNRLTDGFTSSRLIGEQSRGAALGLREKVLAKLENVFNEMEGKGLRDGLNQFWDAWAHVANEPEAEIYRVELLEKGQGLANKFQSLRNEIQLLRRDLNALVAERVEKVNQLAQQLARQNESIHVSDRGHGEANDLRDEREKTLTELSKLVQIDYREDENGLVNVQLGGGWPLVVGRRANQMEASLKNEELGMYRVRGVDPNGLSRDLSGVLRGGETDEIFRLRDTLLNGYVEKLDQLASELAYKVNKVHATGTGIHSAHDALHSSFALLPDAQRIPIPFLKNGELSIQLVDEDNQNTNRYTVAIQAGQDTLADVVARINQTVGENGGFQAKINADGSVSLQAGPGKKFYLAEDQTEFAVVMGFNNFFESLKGAEDLHVAQRLKDEPNKISSGKNMVPGDNQVALAINSLQFSPTMEGDSVTFDEFFNGVLAKVGLEANRSKSERASQQTTIDQFKKLRDETSSVNMDEEVADMVQYQRGFDAAAKFITTVDEMTRTVIDM